MKSNLSRGSSSRSVGVFVVFALLLGALGIASVAWSDMEVEPKGAGDGWGDPNEGNKMLQMAQDPAVVRDDHPLTPDERDHLVPKKTPPNCTDGMGHPIDPASVAGRGCSIDSMNALTQPNPRATAGTLAPAAAQQGMTFSQ